MPPAFRKATQGCLEPQGGQRLCVDCLAFGEHSWQLPLISTPQFRSGRTAGSCYKGPLAWLEASLKRNQHTPSLPEAPRGRMTFLLTCPLPFSLICGSLSGRLSVSPGAKRHPLFTHK